jgi:glycosyltransferase involved in cell wall biosynthesis
MRVLQLSPVDVYPPSRGGEHRSHGLVSAFSHTGDEVIRLAQGGILSNHEPLAGDVVVKREIEAGYVERCPRNPLYDLPQLTRVFGVPSLVVVSEDLLFWSSREVSGALRWADLILAEGPWQAPAVLRAAPEAAVVYSSHNVESDRELVPDSHPLSQWVNRRVRQLESTAVRRSDAVVCASSRDADRFADLFDAETPLLVAPNATYADRLTTEIDATTAREHHGIATDAVLGVFVGSDYGPNNEAAIRLAELVPEIRASVPAFEALIVGECGRAVDDPPPGVHVAGFVEALDPLLASADVALNPVTRGSGTNLKTFDYFVHRLPVLTTPFGARGIEVTHRKDAIVAPVEEFPEWVRRIADDRDFARRIGTGGRALLAERYTWDRVSRELQDALHEVFDGRYPKH